ncbi:hypothetical protein AB0C12_21655 [Actinoplanes sp. NPDC048967]|uniref:hypothetical protein n=1 Tax=Actinoplanes sp. NPDC048967 TaxID=3155269 RepID=UPI0033FABDD8
MEDQLRYRDPGTRSYDLAIDVDVVCPRCGGRAFVIAEPVDGVLALSWPRRFVCPGCGRSAFWEPARRWSCWGGPTDPFFGLPLWLRTTCCGGRTLWAFNRAHLELLEGHLAAGLRERGTAGQGLTLLARLPAWLKAGRHRGEVLRALDRLRRSLD